MSIFCIFIDSVIVYEGEGFDAIFNKIIELFLVEKLCQKHIIIQSRVLYVRLKTLS